MRIFLSAGIASILVAGALHPGAAHEKSRRAAHLAAPPHKQLGKASVYSSSLQGRHMTDGERFNIHSSSAASKTLPIGTVAKVTNLETGKSAQVVIKDRGPVPKGRVVDLTPHTASEIGLTRKEGIAPVAIVPTHLPTPGTKVGTLTVPGATQTAAAHP